MKLVVETSPRLITPALVSTRITDAMNLQISMNQATGTMNIPGAQPGPFDAPALTVVASPLPKSLTLQRQGQIYTGPAHPLTYTVTGTPQPGDGGRYPLNVTWTDGAQSFNGTVRIDIIEPASIPSQPNFIFLPRRGNLWVTASVSEPSR